MEAEPSGSSSISEKTSSTGCSSSCSITQRDILHRHGRHAVLKALKLQEYVLGPRCQAATDST